VREFKEKIIAVVGVSNNEEKFGFKIFRDLLEAGFNVKGINPREVEVLGRKIYASLNELESVPDLVITVVPPAVTEKIVETCKEIGVKEIWMQPGSESEIAVQKAKQYGISVTYNACFMRQQGIW
jgi:predicted CoA-binding protein